MENPPLLLVVFPSLVIAGGSYSTENPLSIMSMDTYMYERKAGWNYTYTLQGV